MVTEDVVPLRRALVSVWDKRGLDVLARGLAAAGTAITSTGSTAAAIRAAGVGVVEVSELTGFPEILDGRVKTLHPAVHAGILADRSKQAHRDALVEHDIPAIDLVVVNFYPFAAEPGIELIDIGGPAMVRAAAKNHAAVAVVTDPGDYPALLAELEDTGGISAATRRRLAGTAFARTAAYDADVAAWFAGPERFPALLGAAWERAQSLRYGENPHQGAAFYRERGASWGLGSARQLSGRELSYNNLLDADAAWLAAADFDRPCVAIIKHTNPAGLAVADSLVAAYPEALAGDPVSAFGGIVAVNRRLDAGTARQIVQVFTEVVVAPAYDDDALEVLRTKRNLRVLVIDRPDPPDRPRALRSVSGGLLAADADTAPETPGEWTVPTRAQPGEVVRAELAFAWQATKHVKSNAIVLTRGGAIVGVGAGQMSRVDSVRLAVRKAGGRSAGAALAGDAFFPFRDGVDAALEAGVDAVISPGGSVRDAEVVAACDERGVPMIFTGRRHFRH
jgi:phosphoribosylaminoimidazolecarboxamide formyltransferase/IMP cyclohydrolase